MLVDEKGLKKIIMEFGKNGWHNRVDINFSKLLFRIIEYVGCLIVGHFDLP